jgi:hypothetical protein
MFIPIIAISVVGEARAGALIARFQQPDALATTFWIAAIMIIGQALLFAWALVRFKRGRLIL